MDAVLLCCYVQVVTTIFGKERSRCSPLVLSPGTQSAGGEEQAPLKASHSRKAGPGGVAGGPRIPAVQWFIVAIRQRYHNGKPKDCFPGQLRDYQSAEMVLAIGLHQRHVFDFLIITILSAACREYRLVRSRGATPCSEPFVRPQGSQTWPPPLGYILRPISSRFPRC
jgi:hypothetical protein